MLAPHYECIFVTNDPGKLPAGFSELQIPVAEVEKFQYKIPAERKESDETPFDLDPFITGDEVVVTDGYWFGPVYQRRIKDKGCKLVCVDDEASGKFYADIIINHAPGVTPANYKTPDYTFFALGADYAMLRPLFLRQAALERKRRPVSTALICFGGSDYLNLTIPSVKAVIGTGHFSKIFVVTGAGYLNGNELKAAVSGADSVSLYSNLDEPELLSLMLRSDLAVVPASGILFEALAAECLAVSGMYTANQRQIYEGFIQQNAIFGCGDFSELGKDLRRFLTDSDTWQPRKLIDGLSASRIVGLIKKCEAGANHPTDLIR